MPSQRLTSVITSRQTFPATLPQSFLSFSTRELHEDFSFEIVPFPLLMGNCWTHLHASRFQHDEPAHLIEAVKHISHDHQCHGHHQETAGDMLGVVLALSKGKCARSLPPSTGASLVP